MSNSPTLFWDTVLNYIESVPSPMPLKKILVIKNHGGLGDYLLALPAINKIVEHFPDTVVVTPDYLFELISNLSNLKNVIPDSLFKSYDFKCNSIIDLGNYPNIQTTLKFPSHRRKRQHASQHYIDAVSRLDKCINAKPAQYPYFRKKTSKEYEISKYITIHPGAGFLKKCWEPINYYALIEKIKLYFPNLEIKIILGKNDPNPMKNEKKISGIDIVKNISLFKVAKILMHSIVHIGNDSGITHLAGALDIPIVALYGPTGPGTWSPVSSQKNIIYGKKNCDKECDYNVLKSCQNQTCLSSITVDEVIFMIMKIIYQRYCIKDSGCVAYLHPCLEIIEYSDALCLHNKLTCEDLLVFGNIKKALSFLNSLKDGCKITNPAPFKGEILSLFNFLKTEELLMLLPIKIY
jgi:ADP-heptose:LPS heptosyltransferase